MNDELVPKLARVEHCCRATPSCFAISRVLPAVQPQCARFWHPQVIWTSCRSAVIASASESHPLRMKSAKPVGSKWTSADREVDVVTDVELGKSAPLERRVRDLEAENARLAA